MVADEFVGARLFLGGQFVARAMRHADGLLQTLKVSALESIFFNFVAGAMRHADGLPKILQSRRRDLFIFNDTSKVSALVLSLCKVFTSVCLENTFY